MTERIAEACKAWMAHIHTGSPAPDLSEIRKGLTPSQSWKMSTDHLGVTASEGTVVMGKVEFEGLNDLNYATLQPEVEMGLLSYAAYHSFIGYRTRIGRFCSIAMNAVVGAGEHHADWLTTSNYALDKPRVKDFSPKWRAIVGHDVWVGANAVVRAGVTVNDGAIVGAGAVVTNDVRAYAVVGGSPACTIRYRFPDKTIDRLMDLRWWELPLDQIKLLPFHDVEECINEITVMRA